MANDKEKTEHILQLISEPNVSYLRDMIRNKRLLGISECTAYNYVVNIYYFLKDIGFQDARTITRNDIEDWYLSKKDSTNNRGRKPSAASMKSSLISVGVLMRQLYGDEEGRRMTAGIRVKVPLTTVKEEQLLTDDELKRMMQAATCERDRALVALAYSTGARLGEFAGANLRDVTIHKYGATLHVDGKTGERDIDFFVGVPELKSWLNVHPMRENPDAPLFCTLHPRGNTYPRLSFNGIREVYYKLAERAGVSQDKKFNPHGFRHKRATDVAEFLTHSDMKVMFGWADGSNMPSVYVHSSERKVRAKLAERAGIRVPETQAPTSMVKQCPVCGCINGANDKFCANCYTILDPRLAEFDKKARDFMQRNISDIVQ